LEIMDGPNENIAAFAKQGWACRGMGSPLTGDVLDALADILDTTTATGRCIMAWPVEPLADALPLRLAGGLHALARSGRAPALTALYGGQGDAHTILRDVLAAHDDWLERWLASPPQTNEVMRSAALMAGLMVVTALHGQPIELLELGSSAGLNLNLDRFNFTLGGVRVGDPASGVKIAPVWNGTPPPLVSPDVVGRAGVDIRPVDLSDDKSAQRLIAYVWPDQTERLARIEAAIDIARAYPPGVTEGDAAEWVERRLSLPQPAGTTRVVMHSVFWQYLPPQTQAQITASIERAGQRATADCPLAWVRFEPLDSLYTMALTVRMWPDGAERHLANCHPHCAHIDWL
jgi:hypothetical protein